MKAKIEQTRYILPTFWACNLINGENNLESDDLANFQSFLRGENKGIGEGHWSIETEGDEIIESNFYKFHDVLPYGVLACDCFTYIWSQRVVDEASNI